MLTYSNPRLVAEFNDWPIGGSQRGQCKFEVQAADPRTAKTRVARTTTNKAGQWCKPKLTTYVALACIVDGSDGRTYILGWIPEYESIRVQRSDFMDQEHSYKDSQKPEEQARFAELMALIEHAYEA